MNSCKVCGACFLNSWFMLLHLWYTVGVQQYRTAGALCCSYKDQHRFLFCDIFFITDIQICTEVMGVGLGIDIETQINVQKKTTSIPAAKLNSLTVWPAVSCVTSRWSTFSTVSDHTALLGLFLSCSNLKLPRVQTVPGLWSFKTKGTPNIYYSCCEWLKSLTSQITFLIQIKHCNTSLLSWVVLLKWIMHCSPYDSVLTWVCCQIITPSSALSTLHFSTVIFGALRNAIFSSPSLVKQTLTGYVMGLRVVGVSPLSHVLAQKCTSTLP